MASVKFYRTTSQGFSNATKQDGGLYFLTDTGALKMVTISNGVTSITDVGLPIGKDTDSSSAMSYKGLLKALNSKANLTQSATRVFRSTSSDTPVYLRGNTNETFLGFRDKDDNILGYLVVDNTKEPFFYDLDAGYFPLLISSNFKSSRVYDGYSRKIFKGSFGFLPDIGSSGSATFTFSGISGHSPSGTATAQTVVSHRLTAWFCTKPGKTGANGDANYYKIVILTMPSSLLDLDAIGAQTFMVPKGNTVTLTVSGISSAKSINYIADGTWKNTTTGE